MRMHTWACMHVRARVSETMKEMFFALKFGFGMNCTLSGNHSIPLFFNYKMSYMVPFHNTKNPKEEHKIN